MYYVYAAYDHYPRGGFNDFVFKGSYEDCKRVEATLYSRGRYDRVYVVSDHVNKDLSVFGLQ